MFVFNLSHLGNITPLDRPRMNWTGGQLRRSDGQGPLSRIQRHSFAKSRRVNEIQSTPSQVPAIPLDQDQFDDRMEVLKRRLLQTPDWASLSAARPLDISFAQEIETERFGKRRKLNAVDRKRLDVTNSIQPISGLFQFRQKNDLTEETNTNTNQIKISINGQLAKPHSEDSPEFHTHTSSQTMLLNHEASSIPFTPCQASDNSKLQDPWTQRTNRLLHQSNFTRAPLSLQNLLKNQAQPSAAEKSDAVAHYISQAKFSTRSMSNSLAHDQEIESSHGPFAFDSSYMVDDTQPELWQFEVKENFTEVQTEVNTVKSVSPDRETLVPKSLTPSLVTMSFLEPTSWLPQAQQRRIFSSPVDYIMDGRQDVSANELTYPSPLSPFLGKTTITSQPSHMAVKFFGQVVS